jgi:hypothetical protein
MEDYVPLDHSTLPYPKTLEQAQPIQKSGLHRPQPMPKTTALTSIKVSLRTISSMKHPISIMPNRIFQGMIKI